MRKFSKTRVCLAIGRGLSFPVKLNLLRNHEEIEFFRKYALFEMALPLLSIIVIDNF